MKKIILFGVAIIGLMVIGSWVKKEDTIAKIEVRDENNDVVVKSCNIGWVVNNDGRLANASPNFIISNLNKMVNVQVHSYGKPVMLNDKVIIKLWKQQLRVYCTNLLSLERK